MWNNESGLEMTIDPGKDWVAEVQELELIILGQILHSLHIFFCVKNITIVFLILQVTICCVDYPHIHCEDGKSHSRLHCE